MGSVVEMQAYALHELWLGEVSDPLAVIQGFCKLGVVMEQDW